MNRPIKVILWGYEQFYRSHRDTLFLWKERGEIEILAVTATNPPAIPQIDGIPVIHPAEIRFIDYDYLLPMVSGVWFQEVIESILRTPGVTLDRIVKPWTLDLAHFSFPEYHDLRSRPVSIFSNSCWGGFASRLLSIEHRSPFKNLFLMDSDYLRLLQDPRLYCEKTDPVFSRWMPGGDEGQERYPVLSLGDVELYCNHDSDPDVAIANWLRRREKICWDNLFVEMSTEIGQYEREFSRLDGFTNRVCFVPWPTPYPTSVYIRPTGGGRWIDDVHRDVYTSDSSSYNIIPMLRGDAAHRLVRPKEKSMIKVSVIIPVYDVEPWLPACLDSVLGQTLRDIEVICIDDHSPDGCPAILDDYAARDDRLRVFHLPENHRQGYGRNLGLREARGKYVYFLDSDDLILPETLEELYDLAEKESLDAVFFDAQSIYENEELARQHAGEVNLRRGHYPKGTVTGMELYRKFVRYIEWTCYVQRQFWSAWYLRSHSISFPEWEHEDEFFAFRGILLAERCRYVRKAYFIHRFRPDSVMTRPASERDFSGYFATFCCMLEFVRERHISLGDQTSAMMYFYRWCESHYDELDDKRIEELLPEEYLGQLDIFRLNRRPAIKPLPLTENKAAWLRDYRHIFVYGTGSVARRAFSELADHGFVVDGFVVSRAEDNPRAFCGRPVTVLSELDADRECSVVLTAMIREYEEEVKGALQAANWKTISFLH